MTYTDFKQLNIKTHEQLLNKFQHLNEDARVWVHMLSAVISNVEIVTVNNLLQEFTEKWSTHGSPTPGNFVVYKNRIVILVNPTQVSGCSIDSSYEIIKQINRQLGGGTEYPIYYLSDNTIIGIKREDVRTLIDNNTITATTPIINLQLTSIAELRAHKTGTTRKRYVVVKILYQ